MGQDATQAWLSLLKISADVASRRPFSPKSFEKLKTRNFVFFIEWEKLQLGILKRWVTKTCAPLSGHGGGRGATKTALLIVQFSADVASQNPFGPKT